MGRLVARGRVGEKMILIICIVGFYLIGCVLAYGTERANRYSDVTFPTILSWVGFLVALHNFGHGRQVAGVRFCFRDPYVVMKRREIKRQQAKRLEAKEPVWNFTDGKDRAELWRTK